MYWTYAVTESNVTFHAHTTRDSAELHYHNMRTYGGPRRIGFCRRKMLQPEIERYATDYFSGLQVSFIEFGKA